MRKEEKELTWILSAGKTLNNQQVLGKDGFTLLELILVLFLMGLMAGIVLPFVVSTLDRVKLQSEARQISSTDPNLKFYKCCNICFLKTNL